MCFPALQKKDIFNTHTQTMCFPALHVVVVVVIFYFFFFLFFFFGYFILFYFFGWGALRERARPGNMQIFSLSNR